MDIEPIEAIEALRLFTPIWTNAKSPAAETLLRPRRCGLDGGRILPELDGHWRCPATRLNQQPWYQANVCYSPLIER